MSQGVSQLLEMGKIQPLIGNPYNGPVNPYYWVDDNPLLYGNIGGLGPSTNVHIPKDASLKSLGNTSLLTRLGVDIITRQL